MFTIYVHETTATTPERVLGALNQAASCGRSS